MNGQDEYSVDVENLTSDDKYVVVSKDDQDWENTLKKVKEGSSSEPQATSGTPTTESTTKIGNGNGTVLGAGSNKNTTAIPNEATATPGSQPVMQKALKVSLPLDQNVQPVGAQSGQPTQIGNVAQSGQSMQGGQMNKTITSPTTSYVPPGHTMPVEEQKSLMLLKIDNLAGKEAYVTPESAVTPYKVHSHAVAEVNVEGTGDSTNFTAKAPDGTDLFINGQPWWIVKHSDPHQTLYIHSLGKRKMRKTLTIMPRISTRVMHFNLFNSI